MLFGILSCTASVCAFAELQPRMGAPEFPKNPIWCGLQGQQAPTLKSLRGKVILIDFWDYTCINCVRTFPHLKGWYERYHALGLEIIGVHKGEFGFASVPENVQLAYERFQLPYPTIIDVKDVMWRAYDCTAWPVSFLIDRHGYIQEVHQGEGSYSRFEKEIQVALKQGHPEVDISRLPITAEGPISGPDCGLATPEIYVGYARANLWSGGIANKEGFHRNKVVAYAPTARRVPKGFFTEGRWLNEADAFESVGGSEQGEAASLGITYRGREVYAVLGRSSKEPVDVVVTRDGQAIPVSARGKDVHTDAGGNTVITIDAPRMYYVIAREDSGTHELKFTPKSAGVQICSFTFGNRCLEDCDHK
ncbi:MAG TPA: redoxin domain-containing protein [Acidobacteriota bacterium]|nr:redoxin domain-containing protein [Acidobacteriota bacterium]